MTALNCCPEHHDGYQALFHTVKDITGSCRLVVERADPKMDSLIYAKVSAYPCDCCSMTVSDWYLKNVHYCAAYARQLEAGPLKVMCDQVAQPVMQANELQQNQRIAVRREHVIEIMFHDEDEDAF